MNFLKVLADLKAISDGMKAKDWGSVFTAAGDLLTEAASIFKPVPGPVALAMASNSGFATACASMAGASTSPTFSCDDCAAELDKVIAEMESHGNTVGAANVGALFDGSLLKIILPIILKAILTSV